MTWIFIMKIHNIRHSQYCKNSFKTVFTLDIVNVLWIFIMKIHVNFSNQILIWKSRWCRIISILQNWNYDLKFQIIAYKTSISISFEIEMLTSIHSDCEISKSSRGSKFCTKTSDLVNFSQSRHSKIFEPRARIITY